MTTTQADGTGAVGKRTPRHAALAGFMGSAVEYYDFFLFGSAAALIFPHVFFPSDDNAALVMSFATFGVAYIARPIGALILGHFGFSLEALFARAAALHPFPEEGEAVATAVTAAVRASGPRL